MISDALVSIYHLLRHFIIVVKSGDIGSERAKEEEENIDDSCKDVKTKKLSVELDVPQAATEGKKFMC